jgi:hypothetical protein
MKNVKKVAAGVIAGAAITAAPLVAFAAPAFADTGSATPVTVFKEGHVAPAFHTKTLPMTRKLHFPAKSAAANTNETHVLVNSAAPETKETHVLVNAASAGSLQGGNAAHCGGFGVPPC